MFRPTILRDLFIATMLAALSLGCSDSSGGDDGGGAPDTMAGCASDDDCSDGVFCNGVEVCDVRTGVCEAGVDPCAADDICDEAADSCTSSGCENADQDGDGHDSLECGGDDCDDADPNRFPGNAEVCDGELDEDCDATTFGVRDSDGDGYIDARCCNGDLCGDDCDDLQPAAHPTEAESCDGIDNDCNGVVDDAELRTIFRDQDGDLHGDPTMSRSAVCEVGSGWVAVGDDCDDGDARRHPGLVEVCDEVDNDCDSTVDEETVAVPWYVDADDDGWGSTAVASIESCEPIAGRVVMPGDCDDTQPGRNPSAPEVCDLLDNDCDTDVDEGVETTFFRDADGDGFGNPAGAVSVACSAPMGFVADATDCDDAQGGRNPGVPEVCDTIEDNDCDPTTFEFDMDRDGVDALGCGGADCDDTRMNVRPGLLETCDGIDNDCSTGGGPDVSEDVDSDGHSAVTAACMGGLPRDDCDDGDAGVYLGAPEICNGVDDDCDGATDEEPAAELWCNREGTVGSCVAGACTIGMCTGTYANCDGVAGNGCEADLETSDDNCGACLNACATGASCVARVCTCPGTTQVCSGACVDVTSDVDHCSACGVACPAGASCVGSACQCPFGNILCDGACVDPMSDTAHCGGCGMRCSGGSCAGGSCDCPGAMGTVCDGTCRDLSVDLAHCGACDAACGGGSCAGGSCACPVANPTLCDGVCTDTVTNRFRCGACDHACGVSDCVAGVCDDVVDLAKGGVSVCAVRATGSIVCWGANTLGQLGNGTFVQSDVPGLVLGLTDALSVDVGLRHACAVRAGGRVSCWGQNDRSQLGDGLLVESNTPVDVVGLTGVVQVAVSESRSCALRSDGTVWCWGANWGQAAVPGGPTLLTMATQVPGLAAVDQIALSQATSCARSGGAVACWGSDIEGQRGDGPSVVAANALPTSVLAVSDAVDLKASSFGGHFCVVRAVGAVWCWGRGLEGQLGDGRALAQHSPVDTGLDGVVALVGGHRDTCAATADSVYCWGGRASNTPTITAPRGGVTELALGSGRADSSCLRTLDGAVECRGSDEFGQQGTGPGREDRVMFGPVSAP